MASEIRVNKIENRSGLGTVTFADTGVDLAGIVTATTFSGSGASLTNLPAANVTGTLPAISGANLTNLPAANLTGTLPAISGANLTGIAATDNVRTGILDVAGVSTFRNTMNVGAAVTISESGIEASGIGITCANINGGAIGGRKNLIINGDIRIAQRATSSTSDTNGYNTVDRWGQSSGGQNEAQTQAQVDVASGTTPYTLGFRKAYKITNGNQTGGADVGDYYRLYQGIEAQDLAQSGWNYTSTTSYITLSFWVKSSVAQNFYGDFRTQDGTSQSYPFETGSLTANTWTKIIKTIPGHSNITIDNDNGVGAYIFLVPFHGTNYTGSVTLNQWGAYDSALRTPDNTATWYTTNDATFEITGVQLEAGSQATAFEHRSLGEELALCQRYCYVSEKYATSSGATYAALGVHYSGYQKPADNWMWVSVPFPVTMRAAPTVDTSDAEGNTGNKHTIFTSTGGTSQHDVANYHTVAFKDHFTISNYYALCYGMKVVGVKAEAEL